MAYNIHMRDRQSGGWRLVTRKVIYRLAGVAALAGLTCLWIRAPDLYASTKAGDGRAQAIAVTRTGILGIGAGLGAFIGVLLNLMETREANTLTRRRDEQTHERGVAEQRSERYTAAITQLGSESIAIRLGGIYALERLATDSPEDQPTIVEVLSAFIRVHSTDPKLREPVPDSQEPPADRSAVDIRAAFLVLARLPICKRVPRADLAGADLTGPASLAGLEFPRGASLEGVDLGHTDLSNARLSEVNLTRIRGSQQLDGFPQLAGTQMDGSILIEAHLSGTQLDTTNLAGADLTGASLQRVRLSGDSSGANFTDANLWQTTLTANVEGAIFNRTKLSEADLENALNLTQAQVNVAFGDSGTGLPDYLEYPPGWPENNRHPRADAYWLRSRKTR